MYAQLMDALVGIEHGMLSLEAYLEHTGIKAVMDDLCSNVVPDAVLLRRIENYDHAFVTKNSDHINFFGGNLIGVQTVRWTKQDKNVWFDDILMTDDHMLRRALTALPDVNENFNVSSDEVNISCLWLVHKFHNSDKLNAAQRDKAKLHVMKILHYKLITSLLFKFFPFPANEKVAMATYERLSLKFQLKQCGTWGAFIEERCKSILDKSSIRYQTYVRFDNDVRIVEMLNDTQTRLRQNIRYITREFYEVLKDKDSLQGNTSIVAVIDGELLIRDKQRLLPKYQRYIKDVVIDANSFIKQEIVNVVVKNNHTLQEKSFIAVLKYFSSQYGTKGFEYFESIVEDIVLQVFDFMKDRGIASNDMINLVTKLKQYYGSSRAADPILKRIRDNVMKFVELSSQSRAAPVKAAECSGFILYVVIRTLSRNHYV